MSQKKQPVNKAAIDLSTLRRTAAELFAHALIEVFPEVQLIGGSETLFGFLYDFKAPFEFQKEFLSMVEERMREGVKRGVEIITTEMMPDNAAALFEHRKQPLMAKRALRAKEPLVSVVRIGKFSSLAVGPFLHSAAEMGPFKLMDCKIEQGITRVFGIVCTDPKELKKEIKKGSPLTHKNHIEWGKELDLFTLLPFGEEGQFVWHPDGVALRERLQKVWCEAGYLPLSTPYSGREQLGCFFSFVQTHPTFLHLVEWRQHASDEEENLEGLFTPKIFTTDLAVAFCNPNQLADVCFSSLQLIIKILKMLTFEIRLVVHACSSKIKMEPLVSALQRGGWDFQKSAGLGRDPRVEMLVADAQGRYWESSCLDLFSLEWGGRQVSGVVSSACVQLERTIALLLERCEGALPFWLAPKQLRLLVVDEKARSYATHVKESLERAGYRTEERVTSKEHLASEIFKGLAKKIPYILVIGEKEYGSETVTVRERESQEKQNMKLTDFFETLKSQEVKFENQ